MAVIRTGPLQTISGGSAIADMLKGAGYGFQQYGQDVLAQQHRDRLEEDRQRQILAQDEAKKAQAFQVQRTLQADEIANAANTPDRDLFPDFGGENAEWTVDPSTGDAIRRESATRMTAPIQIPEHLQTPGGPTETAGAPLVSLEGAQRQKIDEARAMAEGQADIERGLGNKTMVSQEMVDGMEEGYRGIFQPFVGQEMDTKVWNDFVVRAGMGRLAVDSQIAAEDRREAAQIRGEGRREQATIRGEDRRATRKLTAPVGAAANKYLAGVADTIDWSLEGEEFAAQLPPEIRKVAINVANFGQMAGRGTGDTQFRTALNMVARYINPTWTETGYKFVQNWTYGVMRKERAAINNVLADAGKAFEFSKAYERTEFPWVNRGLGWWYEQTGDAKETNLRTALKTLATEFAVAQRNGGAPLQTEIDEIYKRYQTATSKEQLDGMLRADIEFTANRLGTLEEQYAEATGAPISKQTISARAVSQAGKHGYLDALESAGVYMGQRLSGSTEAGGGVRRYNPETGAVE